jgi:hypothetical protein
MKDTAGISKQQQIRKAVIVSQHKAQSLSGVVDFEDGSTENCLAWPNGGREAYPFEARSFVPTAAPGVHQVEL